jgi:probable F420-dependent oxidoreductase
MTEENGSAEQAARELRFGVVLPHFRHVAGATAIRDVAQAAERLGFASLWVTDRAAIPLGAVNKRFGPQFFDPYVTLSYVAGITNTVRIGATVFVLPFRHSVIAARALASLDQLSDGRLIAGVGAGWMEEEFEAIGVPFARRGRLTDEYLDAMLALWASPIASFSGPTIQFENLVSEPRPRQQPHPPIWVGGGTPAAYRRTVKYASTWHASPIPLSQLRQHAVALRETAKEMGRDPATIALTTRAPLRIENSGRALMAAAVPDYPIGTPDQITAALRRYMLAGFEEIVFDTFFGVPELDDATPEGIMQTLKTFARAILPVFKRAG